MKKFVALFTLLVLVVSVFALTACGKKDDATVTPPQSIVQRSSKNNYSSTSSGKGSVSTETGSSKEAETSTGGNEPASSENPLPSNSTQPSSSNQPTSSEAPVTSVDPIPDPNEEKLTTTEQSLKNSLYVSELRILNVGTYMLGSNSGSNYVFKIEVAIDGGETLILNASDMTAFNKVEADGITPTKNDGDTVIGGTNNAFTLVIASGKTAIDASAKTFSDGFSGSLRINFGGKTQISTVTNTLVNGVKFTVNSPATVKVWWVCGGDTRQVDLIKVEESSGPVIPAEVTALIEKINAIGDITADNYSTKEALVIEAETAYTALTAENQALVSNYSTLTTARAKVDEFKAAAELEAQAQAKITAFKNAVTATDAYEFTPSYKALLDAADTAYAEIPATHVSQVETEKTTLEERKARYLADEIASLPEEVKAVISQINAIGDITADNYATKETLVTEAETAYTALTAENQALVSNYSTLTTARAKVDEFKAAEQAAQEAITNFKNAVTAIGTVEATDACKTAIDAAYTAYNAIPSTHVSQVTTEKATLDGYKAQYEEAVAVALANEFKSAVNAITTPITIDSKSAIDDAYAKYAKVPATHVSQVTAEKAILDGYKAEYDAAVQAAADKQAVSDFMIQYNAGLALGSVTEANKASFEAIIASYDALTTSQLALITDDTVATNIEAWRSACAALKPKVVYTYDFSKFSGSVPNSNGVTYFSTSGLSSSGTNKITKNSGSYTLTSNYGVTFAGETAQNKGLAVTSTNLSKFEVSLEIANPSKVTIYFSRASGGSASNMTNVGSGFAYTASGVATSGTARVASQTEVSIGYEKVAVIEQNVSAGTATFNLANNSRACVYKIIVEEN